MKIDYKIRDKKLQYDINKKAVKIWALSSGKIYKYESVTGEEILHFNKTQIIEQGKFSHFLLGKAFERQTEKQVGVIESLEKLSNKKDELKQIEGICPHNLMNDLIYAKLKEIDKLQDIIKKRWYKLQFKTRKNLEIW